MIQGARKRAREYNVDKNIVRGKKSARGVKRGRAAEKERKKKSNHPMPRAARSAGRAPHVRVSLPERGKGFLSGIFEGEIKLKFEDFKKFFFRKPKNALEGTEDSTEGIAQPQEAAIPEKLAVKCEKCGQIVLSDEMEENFGVCPKCGHYKKMAPRARIAMCAENFEELFADKVGKNVLGFPGYDEKIAALREKTGENEGVVCGTAEIGGVKCAVFSMDYRFMMGSMGHAVGEKITATFEYATEHGLPVVGFALSGGARMQEGIVSLMQMAKTSAAVAKHSEAGLLYISVLTDPTTGGVSASFAFEADIIVAEKGALIGFAGPRVIEQTIRQKLPEGFQRAEFQQQKGFADLIVERKEMKEKLAQLLRLHCGEAN